LQGLGLEEAISRWYHGNVTLIKTLRPGTIIKDEAIPSLLRQAKQPTFVTINHPDFWRKMAAEKAFSLVCLKLTTDQADEIPDLLRRLFRLAEFKTRKARMGKVALISLRSIQYHTISDHLIHLIGWSAIESRNKKS
jgi:hypothetical protein